MIIPDLPLEKRLVFIRRTVSIFFILGIAFSFKLWISERFFPLLPVIDFLPTNVHTLNYTLSFLFVLALITAVFVSARVVNVSIVIIVLFLAVQDQNRWQPWVYLYFLFLLPFALTPKAKDERANDVFIYMQLILIGVYAWSGIHKLNPNFITTTFTEILTQFFGLKDAEWIETIKPIGYVIPFVEIGIALALAFPKFRTLGVYVAATTHIFILLYLSPMGINANTVVYPWNVGMITLVFLLFYRVKEPITIWDKSKVLLYRVSAILLIGVMPLFSFWGYWDNYLSFSLYSGKIKGFYIAVADTALDKIDKRHAENFLEIKGLQGGKIIDLNKWAMNELNVPFYPEMRTLRKIAKPFCTLGIPEEQLYFLEFEFPLKEGKFTRFTCSEVTSH